MRELLNTFYLLLEDGEFFGFLIFLFLAVAFCIGSIYFFFMRSSPETARLSRVLSSSAGTAKKDQLIPRASSGFSARLSRPLHRIAVPSEEAVGKKQRLRLIQAGFRSQQAYRNFLAAKGLGTFLVPAIYFIRSMFYVIDLKVLSITLALAAVGYYLPDFILTHFREKRQERVFKGMPDSLDMMVVCVEAGLGMDMTFKRVGEEIRPMYKDLSDEFHIANLEIRAGKDRDEALRNMAVRTGVPEVQNLMTILIQTNRFGTSVAKALRVHSDAMRIKRKQKAEETAAKLTVKLLFPLLLFIFPAIFIVLLGPAMIQVYRVLIPTMQGG